MDQNFYGFGKGATMPEVVGTMSVNDATIVDSLFWHWFDSHQYDGTNVKFELMRWSDGALSDFTYEVELLLPEVTQETSLFLQAVLTAVKQWQEFE